jgi:4-hydroxy-3-methylbut-2-en-1-yl diphosphate reductase
VTGPLVVVPMRVEQAALGRRPRALHVGWGSRRWARAAGTVRAALDHDVHSGLLIVGVCGALTDRLAPGDLVVASELRGEGTVLPCVGAEAMAEALRRTGRAVQVGPICTADHLIDGAERAELAATGALAVDTESAALAGAAGDLPVLAVRAVADTPSRPLRSTAIIRSGLSALRSLRAAAPVLAVWSAIEREVG